MIFIERAALQQQPSGAVEHKDRKGAMKNARAMGAHFLDHADFLIILVDEYDHRCDGHWRLIHPFRVWWHVMER
jgi:hypothetical protein